MSELPDNVDLQWIGRTLLAMRAEVQSVRDDVNALRRDMDMLTRIVVRLDHTVDALREDMRTIWLSQGDLRRRLEALESDGRRV